MQYMGKVSVRLVSCILTVRITPINTLRPIQNGRRFADDTFKRIFLNENVRISIKISLKFVPKVPISNILALVQIMAWRRSGDKPLSEPMMVRLPTHICVVRPQWVDKMFKCWSFNYMGPKCAHCCASLQMLYIDDLMQKRRNSIADALELRLFCIKSSIWVL